MSSALAMVLAAAMAVPGNGPEKVSGELEQGLDLRGKWMGTAEGGSWRLQGKLQLGNGRIHLVGEPEVWHAYESIHEGEGRLSFSFRASPPRLGIYKWEDDDLLVCICTNPRGQRPTTFRASEDQCLLILHRVKPRK